MKCTMWFSSSSSLPTSCKIPFHLFNLFDFCDAHSEHLIFLNLIYVFLEERIFHSIVMLNTYSKFLITASCTVLVWYLFIIAIVRYRTISWSLREISVYGARSPGLLILLCLNDFLYPWFSDVIEGGILSFFVFLTSRIEVRNALTNSWVTIVLASTSLPTSLALHCLSRSKKSIPLLHYLCTSVEPSW